MGPALSGMLLQASFFQTIVDCPLLDMLLRASLFEATIDCPELLTFG